MTHNIPVFSNDVKLVPVIEMDRELLPHHNPVAVYNLLPLEKLSSDDLKILLTPELLEQELKPDDLRWWIGGYLLQHGDETWLTPECCCDLATIDTWKTLLDYREAKWAMHWIGHPWVLVRYEDDKLIFTDVVSEIPNAQLPEPHFAVSVEVLSEAVHQASLEVEVFQEKVNSIWKSLKG